MTETPRSSDHDRAVGPRLSREVAERVISHALKLQDSLDGDPDDGLTLGEVQEVARQVGVPPDLVRRAHTELRIGLAEEQPSPLSGGIAGPREVSRGAVIPHHAEVVRDAIAAWFGDEEGMHPVGGVAGSHQWVKDGRFVVELIRGIQPTRSRGVLRERDAVWSAVEESEEDDEVVVVLRADLSDARRKATAISAVGVLTGGVFGGVVAAVAPDTSMLNGDTLQFLGTFAACFGGLTLGGVGVRRRLWRRTRAALDAALSGIALKADQRRGPHGTKRRLPETVVGTLGRFMGR